jgi:hypothetical protein
MPMCCVIAAPSRFLVGGDVMVFVCKGTLPKIKALRPELLFSNLVQVGP